MRGWITRALSGLVAAAIGLTAPFACLGVCRERGDGCVDCGDEFCDSEREYCELVDPADPDAPVRAACLELPEACELDISCACLEEQGIKGDLCDTGLGGVTVVFDNSRP